MTLLAAERISKRFNDQIIFQDVSFTIGNSERIGLVGKNGSGKTTLFEILAGCQELDSGSITRNRACRIDYSAQEKTEFLELTLFDFVASARQDLLDMRREIGKLEENLAQHPTDAILLDRLGHLQNKYEHEHGFSFENEIKVILHGLGFSEDRNRDRIRNFSGGEKNRAGLARILAGNGNLLLLDEPTNHLDIESTTWLEEYLQKTTKSFVVVSHDRMFLHNTVTTVWEILNGRIDSYVGKFNKFLEQRAERRRLHEHHYRHQREEILRLEDYVRRNMAGQKTKQAQSKLKYLERIKRIPPPESDGSGPTIKVTSSGRSFSHVLAVENLGIGYGDRTVVDEINFDIYRGDKIGVIGANGSGKSTLIKSIIGEIAPVEGDIRLGNNVDVAYFDQELSDLDGSRSVLENLWEVDPSVEVGVIRSFLGRFGFTGDDALKRVSTLSGGEKTKLSLAKLLYHPANFIIFDEPTNHLDIVSREALEEALSEYDGSLLVVSHDRYFLDKVATRVFHIKDGQFRIYEGNYSYFKDKTSARTPAPRPERKTSDSKQAYFDFKERSRQRSRLKKEIEGTRTRIVKLESELERISDDLAHNIPKSDWEKLQHAADRKSRIEEEILDLYHRLEELEGIEID